MTAELPAAAPPAGWYRDPLDLSGVLWRWWDGSAWANVFWQPAPPEPETRRPRSKPPEMPRDYRIVYRPPSHGFHAAMSLLTCGAWIPVWMASAGGRYRIKRGRR